MKKIYLMASLILPLLFLSACQDADLGMSMQEFKEKIIQANTQLESYEMTMDMESEMTFDFMGESMSMDMTAFYEGAVDRKNKKTRVVTTSEMDMFGMTETVVMDMYIVDDYLYMGIMDEWMKVLVDEQIWDEQDQVELTTSLIESGEIIFEGEERVDGTNYYVITLKPDLETLMEIALESQGLGDLMFGLEDFTDMIREYDFKVWINKETFVIEISEDYIHMVIEDIEGGEGGLSMKVVSKAKIKNINEPVTINLPTEALKAQELPSFYW